MAGLTSAAPFSMLNSLGSPYSLPPQSYPSSGAAKNSLGHLGQPPAVGVGADPGAEHLDDVALCTRRHGRLQRLDEQVVLEAFHLDGDVGVLGLKSPDHLLIGGDESRVLVHPETQLDLFLLRRWRSSLLLCRRLGRGRPSAGYQAENQQHDQSTQQCALAHFIPPIGCTCQLTWNH
jgi:hypothetical protein